MAGLELYLDATGMQRGAEAAKKALTDVEQGAKKTTESLDKVVTNVNKTGQALGGGSGGGAAPAQGGATSAGTGLAARISGVSGALSGLQSAANQTTLGGFAFQVGKLYDDFQQLKGGIDGGVTGFQALKAVMRAHPIFTITTIISAAAGAFGLLNSAMVRPLASMTSWPGRSSEPSWTSKRPTCSGWPRNRRRWRRCGQSPATLPSCLARATSTYLR